MWPKIIWRQAGGLPECPYFHRTVIDFGLFSIRVHEWHSDDDHRAYHDHPYWFWTFVLKGGYTDVSPAMNPNHDHQVFDKIRAPAIRFRAAEFKHSVQNVIPGTITVLITGKPFRRWGFWVNGKLIKRDKYFATQGHHPCDPTKEPVRMKPGGERIEH